MDRSLRYLSIIILGIVVVWAPVVSLAEASNSFAVKTVSPVSGALLNSAPAPQNRGQKIAQSAQTETLNEIALWESVKDSRDPKVLASYLQQYPTGMFAPLARIFINNLTFASKPQDSTPKQPSDTKEEGEKEPLRPLLTITAFPQNEPTPVPKTPDVPKTEPELPAASLLPEKERILNLQRELARVGCAPGRIDGQWGGKGRQALARFKRFARLELAYDDLSVEVYEAVKGQEPGLCPPQVQLRKSSPQPAQATSREKRAKSTAATSARRAEKSKSNWNDCMFEAMSLDPAVKASDC